MTPETELARLPAGEEWESSALHEEERGAEDASFAGEEAERIVAEHRELSEKLLTLIAKYAESAIFLPSAEGARITFDDALEDAEGADDGPNALEGIHVEPETADDLALKTLARLGIFVNRPDEE